MAACSAAHSSYDPEENHSPSTEEGSALYRGSVTRLGDLLRHVEIVDDEWGDVEFPTGGFLLTDSDDEEGFDFDADSIITSRFEEREERILPHSAGLKKVLALERPIPKPITITENEVDGGRCETELRGFNNGVEPSVNLMSPASIDKSTGKTRVFEAYDNGETTTESLFKSCQEKENDLVCEFDPPAEQQFSMSASPPSVSNKISQTVGSLALLTTASTETFRRVAWCGGESDSDGCALNVRSREGNCSDSKVSASSLSPSLSNIGDQNVETMDDDFDFGSTEPINLQLQLASRFVTEKQPETILDDWNEPPIFQNTNSSQEHSSPPSSYTAQHSRRGSCASPTPDSSAVSVIMSDDEQDSFDEIIIPEEMSTLKLAIRKCDDDPNASLASDTSVASHMDMTKEHVGRSNSSEKADSDDEDILSGLEVSEGSFSQAKNPHVVSRLAGMVSSPLHHLRRESISFSSIAAAAAFASPHTSPIPHSSSRIPRLLGGALSPVKANLLSKSPDAYEMQTIIKTPRSLIHSSNTSPSKSFISPTNADNITCEASMQRQPTRSTSLPNSPCQGTSSIFTIIKKNIYTAHSPSTPQSAIDNTRHPSGANGTRPRIPANPPAFGSSSPARIPLGRRSNGRVSREEHDFARIMRRPKTAEKYGDGSELDSIDDLPTSTNGETPCPLDGPITNTASARRTPLPHPTTRTTLLKPSTLKSTQLQGRCDTTMVASDVRIGTSPSTKLPQPTTLAPKSETSKKRSFSQSATSHHENRPQSDHLKSNFSTKKTGSSGQSLRQRKPANKPTLIKNLNASTTVKVVGDMVYNPALQRWEGNEGALKAFEKRSRHKPPKTETTPGSGVICSFNESRFNRLSPSLSSRSPSPVKSGNNRGNGANSPNIRMRSQTPRARPALITPMTGDGCGGIPQIIGTMVFDPKQMRWLSTEAEEENVFAELEDTDTETDVTPSVTDVLNNASTKFCKPNVKDPSILANQLHMWQESNDESPRRQRMTTGQDTKSPGENSQNPIRAPTPLTSSLSTSNRGGNYNIGEEFVITPMLSTSLELAEKVHRSELGTFWPRGFGGLCLDNIGPKRGLSSGNIWKAVGGPGRKRMGERDTIAAGRSHLYDIRMIAGGTSRR